MAALSELRIAADKLEAEFRARCIKHYPIGGRWDFYVEVCTAHDAWIEAVHAFYLARDGEDGFLGKTKTGD